MFVFLQYGLFGRVRCKAVIGFQWREQVLFLLVPHSQILLHFGVQGSADALLAVQRFQCDFIGIVILNDIVQNLQAFLNRMLFNGIRYQCG